MLENIDIRSKVAVYIQIENHIQFSIASGRLKEGERLPSVRELSETLGVNQNTVAKAYRDLEVMGYVYTRRGMGVFIENDITAKCRTDCRRRVITRMHEVTSEAKASGMKPKELKTVAQHSFASKAGPYQAPPESLLALAKAKPQAK